MSAHERHRRWRSRALRRRSRRSRSRRPWPRPRRTRGAVASTRRATPRSALQVLLPAEIFRRGTAADFTVRENGVTRRVDARRGARTAQREPIDVVLVVDTSGSMKGAPLDDAKRAADAFVDALRPDDAVAIVSFSDTPRVVAGLHRPTAAAIDGAHRGTRSGWRDRGLRRARSSPRRLAAATSVGARSVVLLSDGGDTASTASRSAMLDVVAKSRIPVYALALQSPEADPALLAEIAKQSRGRTFCRGGRGVTDVRVRVGRPRATERVHAHVRERGCPTRRISTSTSRRRWAATVRRLALVVPNPALALSIPIGATGVTVTPMTAGIARHRRRRDRGLRIRDPVRVRLDGASSLSRRPS